MSLRLVVAALILATATALGMIAYQIAAPHQIAFRPAVSDTLPPPMEQSYLVAAHALPPGTLVRNEDFTTRSAPLGKLPPGAVEDTPQARADIRGALVTHYLEPGAPVTKADILRPRDRGFLAAVLAPGTRAISIAVDPVTGVSGLIWPGDRVDVILTQALDKAIAPVSRRILSETVMRDLRVIAVDQQIVQGAPPTATAAGRPTRTVTLQVTPDQAEQLNVAERLGRLSLTIRSIGATKTANRTQSTVFGGDVSPALSRAGQSVGASVLVIQGDKRSEVNFR